MQFDNTTWRRQWSQRGFCIVYAFDELDRRFQALFAAAEVRCISLGRALALLGIANTAA